MSSKRLRAPDEPELMDILMNAFCFWSIRDLDGVPSANFEIMAQQIISEIRRTKERDILPEVTDD